MESKTATAAGIGIASVITPLVFPAISLSAGIALYAVAGGLFLYAGRDRVRALIRRGVSNSDAGASTPSPHMAYQYLGDGPSELTISMVRRLAAQPISPKTTQVLRSIASSGSTEFHMKDAIGAVNGAKTYLDLRGVWAGLTRRTRNILNDPAADLIWWRENGIYDEQGNYIDHIGMVAPLTHASLRKHFRIS